MEKVEASNQIADEITLELYRQIEKLEKASSTVQDTRSDIKKANVYIKYFARELLKDKIIIVLVALCAIAVIVILALKFKNGAFSGTPTTSTNTNNPNDTDINSLIYI